MHKVLCNIELLVVFLLEWSSSYPLVDGNVQLCSNWVHAIGFISVRSCLLGCGFSGRDKPETRVVILEQMNKKIITKELPCLVATLR